MKRVVINIRASKNISGLVKVWVTSPAGLMKFFLNVEPCKGGVCHTHWQSYPVGNVSYLCPYVTFATCSFTIKMVMIKVYANIHVFVYS